MLVEIPDPQVIAAILISFSVGVLGVFLFNKVRQNTGSKIAGSSYLSRLEYYERQLIDMKIRLDALDLAEKEGLPVNTDVVQARQGDQISQKEEDQAKKEPTKLIPKQRIPNIGYEGLAEYVLGLITQKEMTSRDIQVTIGRSREHTSRLMKRLFEDGLVERNTKTKPFTYRITQKGKERLEMTGRTITA